MAQQNQEVAPFNRRWKPRSGIKAVPADVSPRKDVSPYISGERVETQFKKQKVSTALKDLDQAESGNCAVIGRKWTLSIAVPGSMLENAYSHEMKTYITGQIARTAAVFCVDEVVVYDDKSNSCTQMENSLNEKKENSKKNVVLMAKILQYAECPQYLRSYFFPLHDDLKSVGLLNPLDAPHHLRSNEHCIYREGAVVDKETKKFYGEPTALDPKFKSKKVCFADVGLRENVKVHGSLQPGLRVTVKLRKSDQSRSLDGDPVPPHTPRTASGLYWGYSVRVADSLSAVFSQSPHEDGYDLTVGISPNGQSLDQNSLPSFRNAVVVFAGIDCLEQVLNEDPKLEVKDPVDLFDFYVNPLSPLGSTGHIRTEESLLIGLSVLRPKFTAAALNQ